MKGMARAMKQLPFIVFFIWAVHTSHAQSLPEGFQIETIITDIDAPAGMVHSEIGISYVWELSGKVWPVENDVKSAEPIIDISDEVGFWSDHGLMSVALDPNFMVNGRMYLLYVVDRHHLLYAGTPEYDPEANLYEDATIGRLVRYEVDMSDPTQLASTERHILIGAQMDDGIPVVTTSHGLGSIVFGTDGTLLVSSGDANSPGSTYNGTGEVPELGYDTQALADGILKPEENVGAFRSQFINSYCGKIIRIDPETGLGVPSNPFYDAERPNEPISKVWALGFRNPFRFTKIPGTGSTDPDDAQPGEFIVGDVGDWTWEEINKCTAPGQNFGWPIYEGPISYYQFVSRFTSDFTKPLPPGCGQEFLYFQDLIVDPDINHSEKWPGPCNEDLDPMELPLFVHERPFIAYRNVILAPPDLAVVPTFDENEEPSYLSISDPSLGIESDGDFSGASSIAGVFYQGANFPEEFNNTYFQADITGWLRVFTFDEFGDVSKIDWWDNEMGVIVHMSWNPMDEAIYMTGLFPGVVKRLSFAGNLRPVIEVSPDTIYGVSPLTVEYDATESFDPEGTALTFEWDFGDGTTASGATVAHTFTAPDNSPVSFDVTLVVTDGDDKVAQKTLLVALQNTPPTALITGFEQGYLYPLNQASQLYLDAEVFDAESPVDDLDIEWRVFLHHNTHFHLENIHAGLGHFTTIQPVGCGVETFWYRIQLKVTDPQGLQATYQTEIFPDCEGNYSPYAQELIVYPNPATDFFRIHLSQPFTDWVDVDIYNDIGEVVKSRRYYPSEGAFDLRFSTEDLKAGVYVVACSSAGWMERRKLLVSDQ